MERSLTQYGRGVNLGFAIFRKAKVVLPPFLVGNTESGEVWKTRGDLSRAKGFLRVFSSVKVILGGRIPLTVDRPTGKAVHRCTCGFRVD